MEKILSFDVGIIHLAYCFFTKKDGNWDILDWAIIDLTDREAFVFRNKTHHKINMIYRRRDGHIGWIDPSSVE
jgi:hypothetical protein